MNLPTAGRSTRSASILLCVALGLLMVILPAIAVGLNPDPPTSLTATGGTASPVIASLSWQPAENTAASEYRIYAASRPDGPYRLVAKVAGTSYQFTDGLGGLDYYFRVSAFDIAGSESAFAQVGPVAALWSESPHHKSDAGTSRCLKCHSTHNAGAQQLIREELVSDTGSSSCLGCHNGKVVRASNIASGTVDSISGTSGHKLAGGTPGRMPLTACSNCHATHGAIEDARMLPGKSVNGTSVASAGNTMCVSCHDSTNTWYGDGYPSTSAPVRDASGYPVSGTWPGVETYNSVSNPHRTISESTQTPASGNDIRRERGSCLNCHAPHGSNNNDTLLAKYSAPTSETISGDRENGANAALCYRCHAGTVPEGLDTAPTNIKRYSTSATGTAGHTIKTAGGSLPVGSALPCYECHNPHGSARGNASLISDERGALLGTSDAGSVRAFCFTCHTTSDTTLGWDSAASAYVTPGAAQVVGLPRTGGVLKLPVEDGHQQGDARSCYECHGSGYGPSDNNVHDPAVPEGSGLSAEASGSPEPSIDSSSSIETSTAGEPSAADAGANGPVPGASIVDTTAPVTTSDAQLVYSEVASVTLTSVDETGGTGVAETYYRVDGSSDATGTAILVVGGGQHTIEFWSVDFAGNIEATKTVSFMIESTQPSLLEQYLGAAVESLSGLFSLGGDYEVPSLFAYRPEESWASG